MIRFTCLILAALSVALGLLTVVKAPPWVDWRMAVLAGEYGYMIAIAPLLILIAAGWAGPFFGQLRPAVLVLALVGTVLLVQPCFQAWLIARGLPSRLQAAFGPASLGRSAFQWSGLFASGPEAVPAQTLRYTQSLDLDFYRASAAAPAPCVVVLHGGGWDSGQRGQIATLNFRLARDGCAVADVSYGLAPSILWPAQRAEVLQAIAYLKGHASELGIDPHRFVLVGRSAGGQIAEAVAYSAHDPAIRGVAGFYAPADMYFAYKYGKEDDILKSPGLLRKFLGGPPGAAKAGYDSASSILLAARDSPPTLLVHGALDTLVWYKQSTRLAARFGEVGGDCCLVTLPWATHAVEYHEQGPAGQIARYSLEWFLKTVTR